MSEMKPERRYGSWGRGHQCSRTKEQLEQRSGREKKEHELFSLGEHGE